MNLDYLRQQIIGGQMTFLTPYGEQVMTYTDYTASGKSLKFIEDYMMRVSMSYANSHTEDDYSGHQTTRLYHEAKEMIRKTLGANDQYVVLSPGSGTTGAIMKLAQILGIYHAPANPRTAPDSNKIPVVFIGPYEHHSNDLIWREGDALVIEIPLDEQGQIDLAVLKEEVGREAYKNRLKIGAFSAASNVSGILTKTKEIAAIMHEHQGLIFFDYAACGPYVKIDMMQDDQSYYDGIYLSPHKFLGGPGTSGLLVFHKKIYQQNLSPTCAGGGTVEYVSSKGYDFIKDIEIREDAGTPPILQVIRAALALSIKEKIGYEKIETTESAYILGALERLKNNPKIQLVGPWDLKERLGILSFNVRHEDGLLHPRFITKLLNDLFGIQARAGCSCAGPYGHRLLGIDMEHSVAYRDIIKEGDEAMKPGWVRLNFHYTLAPQTYAFILDAIEFVAEYGHLFLRDYQVIPEKGLWMHKDYTNPIPLTLDVNVAMKMGSVPVYYDMDELIAYYEEAMKKAKEIARKYWKNEQKLVKYKYEAYQDLSWFYCHG